MSSSAHDLLAAIHCQLPVGGLTHNFYRYPARFSPTFARAAIAAFTNPDDLVLDPFMGGGTAVVEGLASGRLVVGIDLNPLAHFVSRVKTTPLSKTDKSSILEWLGKVRSAEESASDNVGEPIVNLPARIRRLFGSLIGEAAVLPLKRQRGFVRCAMLKAGQWALDCRYTLPSKREILARFVENVLEMLNGLEELVHVCTQSGTPKNRITRRRLLLCRSTEGVDEAWPSYEWGKKARLVLTSPPYPGVHILYHRWQVQGRRETPAPYWLAAINDGHPASHYTFGSRSVLGLENYFRNVEACFTSVRKVVERTATIVQLVAFSDGQSQLPRYLGAMERAGFREFDALALTGQDRVWRFVPNRKWYCETANGQEPIKEVVLFHRPA